MTSTPTPLSALAGRSSFAAYCRSEGYRLPETSRGRETCDRIINALESLLCSRSFDAISVEELLERADVPAGSFYHRFTGKAALRAALLERYLHEVDELIERVRARQPAPRLEDDAGWLVDERITRLHARRGLLRTVTIDYHQQPDRMHRFVAEAAEAATEAVVRRLLGHFAPGQRKSASAAIRIWFYAVSALCRELVLHPRLGHASTIAATRRQRVQVIHEVSSKLLPKAESSRTWSHAAHEPLCPRLHARAATRT